jgi:Na+/proline symporter
MTLGAAAVAAYLLALIGVAWHGRSAAQHGDMFNIFGRQAGLLRATSGYLSLIGAGELVQISQLGYDSGFSLLWFPSGIAAGFVVIAIFGDDVRTRAKALGVTTMVAYVTKVFGRSAGAALAIVFLIALGALLTIQFILGGQLLAETTGLPPTLTSVVMALIIIGYLIVGGYVAVLSTDVLRLVFLGFIVVVLPLAIAISGGFSKLSDPTLYPPLPFVDGATLFVLGLFGAVCAGDVWQTVLASKSKDVLRTSMILAAVAFVIFGLLIGLLGIATKQAVPELSSGLLPLIAATRSVLPLYLAPLLALLIVGSVMATADTEIWVLSTSLISYFKPAPVGNEKKETFHSTLRTRARIAIPIVTGFALLCSILGGDARAIYEGLLVLLTSIAPAMIAVLFSVVRPLAVSFAMWGGLAFFFLLAAYFRLAIPSEFLFAPAVCSLLALVLGLIVDELAGRHTAV